MNQAAQFALKVETDFLVGVEANLQEVRGRQLPGTVWKTVDHDQTDRLRALMQSRGMHDRALLAQLPHNRRKTLYGYERTWWLLSKRRTSVAVASVLSPLADYLSGADASATPAAVDLPALLEHVASLVVDADTPHVIGVCSPTGFTKRARTPPAMGNVTLVLIEPRPDGGWTVCGAGEDPDKSICEIFDPESWAEKIQRVRREIDRRSADLLTAGLPAATIQQETGLDRETVDAGFRAAASADPELRLTSPGEELVLFRGAPATTSEDATMSIPDFIKQLFSLGGDEARKINHLSERRVSLSRRRDRIYEDITKLEQKEADLLEQGRLNKSETVRRRVASQISQMRKEMARLNSTASMLGQQINIVSTHIHNLTLIQQGQMTEMPKTEELTADAVRAEEMLESLKADADLVGSLDMGAADTLTSEDERAILAEFDQLQTAPETTPEPPVADAQPAPEKPAQEPQQREPEAS